jgi:hypothetical protein
LLSTYFLLLTHVLPHLSALLALAMVVMGSLVRLTVVRRLAGWPLSLLGSRGWHRFSAARPLLRLLRFARQVQCDPRQRRHRPAERREVDAPEPGRRFLVALTIAAEQRHVHPRLTGLAPPGAADPACERRRKHCHYIDRCHAVSSTFPASVPTSNRKFPRPGPPWNRPARYWWSDRRPCADRAGRCRPWSR